MREIEFSLVGNSGKVITDSKGIEVTKLNFSRSSVKTVNIGLTKIENMHCCINVCIILNYL